MPTVDLRSDTITRPTPAMRQAMAAAEVGDDVLGDDPTVNELERETAARLGLEAAVFMPSGTMTNQVAIRAHTEPGDELLLHEEAHLYWYEAGAPAALSGVMCRLLPGPGGIFAAATVTAALRPANIHFPRPRLLAVENTHNRGGGTVWPLATLREVAETAHAAGLRVHMDGARLWNACVATGIAPADYAACCDTVSVCFSKGLGAPVGSALAGPADFIARARRFRKMFGGGMRQAGIIAAGALYALRHHVDRLAEDHANARRLAAALGAPEPPSNIVFLDTPGPAADVAAALAARGVLVLATGPRRLRLVTSLAVTPADVDHAIAACRDVLA